MKKSISFNHSSLRFFVACLVFNGVLETACAQLLSLNISSSVAMPMEELIIQVVVRNMGNMPLPLNPKPDEPDFYLYITKGKDENIIALDDLVSPSIVPPFENYTNFFDVGGHRLFMQPGFYSIRAELIINDKLLRSNTVDLEIAKGIELARISGVTIGNDNANVKSYVLEYLKKPKGEDLYLRFEDSSSEITYGVYNLGRVVRSYPPQIKFDEAGNVHVLFQTINSRFVHSVFTSFGVPIRSIAYSGYASSATFKEKPDGELAVVMKDGSPLLRVSDFQIERENFKPETAPLPMGKKITKTGGLFGKPPQ